MPEPAAVGCGSTSTSTVCCDGDDRISGRGYGEWLEGLRGNDILAGRGGDDTLYGGRGDDVLDCGKGSDTCTNAEFLGGCSP